MLTSGFCKNWSWLPPWHQLGDIPGWLLILCHFSLRHWRLTALILWEAWLAWDPAWRGSALAKRDRATVHCRRRIEFPFVCGLLLAWHWANSKTFMLNLLNEYCVTYITYYLTVVQADVLTLHFLLFDVFLSQIQSFRSLRLSSTNT